MSRNSVQHRALYYPRVHLPELQRARHAQTLMIALFQDPTNLSVQAHTALGSFTAHLSQQQNSDLVLQASNELGFGLIH